MRYDTETMDRLYLELSQFTTATTAKELALIKERDEQTARAERQNKEARDGYKFVNGMANIAPAVRLEAALGILARIGEM